MKIGNFISGICLVVLGLFSCTSEEVIESVDGNASLSIVLSVNDAATKAELGVTDNESKINDFYVAIFNEKGTKIDSKIISSTADESGDFKSVTVNEKPGYKVDFPEVNRSQGKVFAVVVANASSVYSNLEACTTYEQLTSTSTADIIIETNQFSDENLAKAGVSEKKNLAEGNLTLTVPLTQLCARIDFGNISIIDSKVATKAGEESVESGFKLCETLPSDDILEKISDKVNEDIVWSNSSKIRNETENMSYMSKKAYLYWDKDLLPGAYYKEYVPEKYSSQGKGKNKYYYKNCYYENRVLVYSKTIETTFSEEGETSGEGGEFTPSSISYTANGKTTILYDDKSNSSTNQQYNALIGEIGTNQSFYTYEFPTDQSLKMRITGTYSAESGGSSAIKPVITKKTVYGILRQSRPSGKGENWSNASCPQSENEIENSNDIEWFEDVISEEETTSDLKSLTTKSNARPITYEFDWAKDVKDINGNSVPLLHGYVYELSLRLKVNNVQLIVKKKDWTPLDIDVTYGGSSN
ncbi:fimbrial protein [Parabacteroides sp.]|uniref:fimbrial protein n=1 Tax=Parabacteroides sp. TaxID=1869337 RepID=UPI00307FDBED